jgi:hypothetical protein
MSLLVLELDEPRGGRCLVRRLRHDDRHVLPVIADLRSL